MKSLPPQGRKTFWPELLHDAALSIASSPQQPPEPGVVEIRSRPGCLLKACIYQRVQWNVVELERLPVLIAAFGASAFRCTRVSL